MKKDSLFILITMFLCIVTVSCKKHDTTTESPTVIVQTFINNAGVTDSIQIKAVNNFVNQLNQSSLWSKFIAIYPMLGGTPNSAKWNLKDPRDLDAAYRLTFYGSPAFSGTGVLFPTLKDYADTHLLDNLLTYNNSSISYYSLTQNSISGYDIGCTDNVRPYNEFAIYHRSDAAEWFGYHALAITPADTKGLFILSATSNDVKRYDNSVILNSKGSAPIKSFTNMPLLIGNSASDTLCGQKVCALATIGYGLSDKDVATFFQIVQTFEGALKR